MNKYAGWAFIIILWGGMTIMMGKSGSMIAHNINDKKTDKVESPKDDFTGRYLSMIQWETEKVHKKVRNGKFWNIEEVDTGVRLFMVITILDGCYPGGDVWSDQDFMLQYMFKRGKDFMQCTFKIDGSAGVVVDQTCDMDFSLTKNSTGRYFLRFFLDQKEVQSMQAIATTMAGEKCPEE